MEDLNKIVKDIGNYLDVLNSDNLKDCMDIPSIKLIMQQSRIIMYNLLLSIMAIDTKFTELDQDIKALKHDVQEKFYYKCDRCETLMESHDAYPPDQVCTSENKSRTSGICGGRFSIRLTREEYLDYFINNA